MIKEEVHDLLTGEGGSATEVVVRRHRTITVLLLLLPLIAAACSSGSEMPTLTFEGDALTYEGPETFDDKTITFQLVNNADHFAQFAWGEITDDGVTSEEHIAWTRKTRDEPPWLGAYYKFGLVAPGETDETKTVVFEGRIDLVAWNPEASSPWTYAAGIFEVIDTDS